jgi:adenosylcobinamide-phosphate synthase
VLAGGVVGVTAVTSIASLYIARRLTRRSMPVGADVLEILLGASALAARDLFDHVRVVEDALRQGDIVAARSAVSRIVGRDTAKLDEHGIACAAIETLAESFCDGVVSPLCYLALGGAPLAWIFKAVSTLDSMIGHREAPYTNFGTFAARCDDVCNYVPARISALVVITLASLSGASARDAIRCVWLDAPLHRSPNGGYPEAAVAGALGLRLGGTVSYDGVAVHRPLLNAAGRHPAGSDIQRARHIVMRSTLAIALALSFISRFRYACAAH